MNSVDQCNVCYIDLTPDNSFKHPKCGKFLHKSCLKEWGQKRISENNKLTCFHCFAPLDTPILERNAINVNQAIRERNTIGVNPHALSVWDVIIPVIFVSPFFYGLYVLNMALSEDYDRM